MWLTEELSCHVLMMLLSSCRPACSHKLNNVYWLWGTPQEKFENPFLNVFIFSHKIEHIVVLSEM